MYILLSSTYHRSYHYGGNEQYLHSLSLGLVKKGHQVDYLTHTPTAKTKDYPYHLINTPLNHFLGKPLPTTDWLINTDKYHLYHASGSGFPILLPAIRAHIPTFLTYQADTHPSLLLKLPALIERHLLLKTFKHIITTTPFYQKYLQSTTHHPSVTYIPMMVPSHLKPYKHTPNKQKRILFIGKLDKHHNYKGLEYLLQAVKLLPSNYQLTVVGDGDRLIEYQKLADSKTKFLGFVPDNKLSAIYARSDALVLPSTNSSEGFGLVLIEAMRLKIPTITTTAIGSASLLSKSKVSILVPPKNPQALFKAIIKVTTQKTSMINRAHKFSKTFTLENMVEKTIKLYEHSLS